MGLPEHDTPVSHAHQYRCRRVIVALTLLVTLDLASTGVPAAAEAPATNIQSAPASVQAVNFHQMTH